MGKQQQLADKTKQAKTENTIITNKQKQQQTNAKSPPTSTTEKT